MRRILIFRDESKPDNNISMSEEELAKNVESSWPNSGNKIWFWGLISELDTPHIQLSFYRKEYTVDYINENFDGVILPDANLFGLPFEQYIDSNISAFEKLKIPIYIISVGVQIDRYEDMDDLVRRIGSKVRKMIDLVYNSGGAVCVRGNITAEFCNKCGAHEVFTGGCPSLYQFGSNLKIEKKECIGSNFKVAVNGHFDNLYGKYYKTIFDTYVESEFFCQDEFFQYLYGPKKEERERSSFMDDIRLIKNVGLCGAELLNHNKVNLFSNPYKWIKYIADNEFYLSFGSRIHGNIAALLAGVPSILHVRDLRTLEMADYYGIPRVMDSELKNQDIYSLYEKMDYTKFNNSYLLNYNKFQDFLISCDLVEKMNEKNKYRCMESYKNNNSYDHNDRYKGKVQYEIANEAFYIYRKYFKRMNMI